VYFDKTELGERPLGRPKRNEKMTLIWTLGKEIRRRKVDGSGRATFSASGFYISGAELAGLATEV
jgi:hypothetical protein